MLYEDFFRKPIIFYGKIVFPSIYHTIFLINNHSNTFDKHGCLVICLCEFPLLKSLPILKNGIIKCLVQVMEILVV